MRSQPAMIMTFCQFPTGGRRFFISRDNPNGGFTLLEMIAMMVILVFLAAIAIPRYIDLGQTAKSQAIASGIAELNGRENLSWTRIKTSADGWQSDADLFSRTDYDLGSDYIWITGPEHGAGAEEGGGTLQFQDGADAQLGRIDSSIKSPAYWYRK